VVKESKEVTPENEEVSDGELVFQLEASSLMQD